MQKAMFVTGGTVGTGFATAEKIHAKESDVNYSLSLNLSTTLCRHI